MIFILYPGMPVITNTLQTILFLQVAKIYHLVKPQKRILKCSLLNAGLKNTSPMKNKSTVTLTSG